MNAPVKPSSGFSARLLLLALSPLLFGAAALGLGQNIEFDFCNYHWYNAYALLSGRTTSGIDVIPGQLQSFFNPLLDVPFYLLGTHLSARASYFILGSVQGLNFILLFFLARRTLVIPDTARKDAVCAGLALFGMTGSAAMTALGGTFNDNLTSLGIFGAMLLILRNLDGLLTLPWPRAARRAALYGLPVGMMVGLKTTCAPFAVGICVALLFVGDDWRRCLKLAFFFGLGVLAGFVITYGWWGWFLYTHYGNPMFPNFNDIFQSPLFPPQRLIKDYYAPTDGSIFALPLLLPFHPELVNRNDWYDLRIPVFYALTLAVAVLYGIFSYKPRVGRIAMAEPRAARFLLCAAIVGYYFWLIVFDVYRYLLPLEMMAPLLIVLCLDMIPMQPTVRLLVASFVLLAVVSTSRPDDLARRREWIDRVVEVSRPELPDDGSLMILMTGYDGYSDIISEFPPSIPFVRIQSRSFFPASGEDLNSFGISRLIQERIDSHKGRLMALIPFIDANDKRKLSFTKALDYFGLETVPGQCQVVIDRVDDYPYALCDVVRLGNR